LSGVTFTLRDRSMEQWWNDSQVGKQKELGRKPTSVPHRPTRSFCTTKIKRPEIVSPEPEVIIRVGRTSPIFVLSIQYNHSHRVYISRRHHHQCSPQKFLKCTLKYIYIYIYIYIYVIVYYKIIRKKNWEIVFKLKVDLHQFQKYCIPPPPPKTPHLTRGEEKKPPPSSYCAPKRGGGGGGVTIIVTLHPLYYQKTDPPVPLDVRQDGKNSCRTKKISTGYGETQIRAENCRLILAWTYPDLRMFELRSSKWHTPRIPLRA